MNRIDENVAVGDASDSLNKVMLRHGVIDVVIDVRHHFNDKTMKPFDSVLQLASAIDTLRHYGYRIFIYCESGIERSPFVAAIYLYQKFDLQIPFLECYDMVKVKRPQTFIHDEWGRGLWFTR